MNLLGFVALVVVLNVVLIALGAVLLVRRRRPHRCRQCGYDTHASSLRCPECGTELDLRPERRIQKDRVLGVALIAIAILIDVGVAVYMFRFLTL